MSALGWLAVGLLGGLGALARFLLDASIAVRAGRRFPLGTLVVNVSGAFLLGMLTGRSPGGLVPLLAGTALLGSYTTFSTWMLESHRLAEDGQGRLAAVNLLLSLALGLLAAAAGRLLGAAL